MTDTTATEAALSEESNPITEAIQALQPPHAARPVIVEGNISGQEYRREFTQKPLSYFAKLEFFGLLGGAIEQVMSGPDGMTVDGMMQSVLGVGSTDLDVFVAGISRLAQHVPGLMEDCYCIWIGVPVGEREFVKYLWTQPVGEGGMSDEDGFGILETFIDQNVQSLKDFFVLRAPGLAKRASARLSGESLQSKPSKPTRRRTAKS
jgi:hypothetical protein